MSTTHHYVSTEHRNPFEAAKAMLNGKTTLKYRYAREIQLITSYSGSEVIYIRHHGTAVVALWPNGKVALSTPILSDTTRTTMNEWLPLGFSIYQKSDRKDPKDNRPKDVSRRARKRWWFSMPLCEPKEFTGYLEFYLSAA